MYLWTIENVQEISYMLTWSWTIKIKTLKVPKCYIQDSTGRIPSIFALFLISYLPSVPLMEKPDIWFLLAKCVKNISGRETSSTCIFTLNVILPQRFFAYFASKNQPPGFFISATLSGNGLKLITMVRRKLKFEESVNKIKLSNIWTKF